MGATIKSTLPDNLDDLKISNYWRRNGNSTRQIDYAIQLLFQGYKVQVLDHHEDGKHENANKDLYNRILKRLRLEHNFSDRNFKADGFKLTIELI